MSMKLLSADSFFDIPLSALSLFRWQFSCEGGDVGFGVFMKKKLGEWMKAGQMQEVMASQRYNAHLVPEDGSLTCAEPGVCKCALNSLRNFVESLTSLEPFEK